MMPVQLTYGKKFDYVESSVLKKDYQELSEYIELERKIYKLNYT